MTQISQPASPDVIETDLTGVDLINQPLLNKGTAFTDEERDAFKLHGMLPPNIGNLPEQVRRRLAVLRNFRTDFERYAFLRDLQDANETLFYSLLVNNIQETLPLVYTPTVGEGCQRFSEIFELERAQSILGDHQLAVARRRRHEGRRELEFRAPVERQ